MLCFQIEFFFMEPKDPMTVPKDWTLMLFDISKESC